MKARDLAQLGIPPGPCTQEAERVLQAAAKARRDMRDVRAELTHVAKAPSASLNDAVYGTLARLLGERRSARQTFEPRRQPAPYRVYGEGLESTALQQMENACRLPVSVAAALMPDAHVGYGLPIGGVLATDNAVIPYAVGVDIACRVKLTVLDLPLDWLRRRLVAKA